MESKGNLEKVRTFMKILKAEVRNYRSKLDKIKDRLMIASFNWRAYM